MTHNHEQPNNRRPRGRTLAAIIGILAVAALALAVPATAASGRSAHSRFPWIPKGDITVTSAEDIAFTEISPFAEFGSAQGDFTIGEHGTFGIFGAGAASPAHTHTDTYYGVVLDGDMNNPFGTETDPPTLAPGSFWTVPAEEQHVTACLSPGQECDFFFHSAGAFDFLQIDALTDPQGDAARSIPVESHEFADLAPYDGVTVLWGDPDTGPYGVIVKIDGKSNTKPMAHRSAFTMVPMTGTLKLKGFSGPARVEAGDLLEAEAYAPHRLRCQTQEDCLIYLFGDGPLDVLTKAT